jgi:hypothetical protein
MIVTITWAWNYRAILSGLYLQEEDVSGRRFSADDQNHLVSQGATQNSHLYLQLAKTLPSHLANKFINAGADGSCAVCGQIENADHLFFSCVLAKFMWSGIREILTLT